MEKDLIILDLVKILSQNALSKTNSVRDYRIFEEFAFHMVSLAQAKNHQRFELHGRFYAVDSTTIDLCMSMFEWAHFRSTKSGVRIHNRLISSRRYLSSTELRPPRYMIPKLWTGLHTSHWLAMFLTGATLTLPGSSPLNNPRPSSLSSGRKASLTMRSSVEKTSLMERIMSSETRLSVLQEEEQEQLSDRAPQDCLLCSGTSAVVHILYKQLLF